MTVIVQRAHSPFPTISGDRSSVRCAHIAVCHWGKRLKSSKGIKDHSKWGDKSPCLSAQKSSFYTVTFSRLISPLFLIEEKEYGGFFPYLQVYPRSRMPHLFSMNCVNRAGVLVPESVLNGAVKASLQGPEMDAYGDELGEGIVHQVFPPLLRFSDLFSLFTLF